MRCHLLLSALFIGLPFSLPPSAQVPSPTGSAKPAPRAAAQVSFDIVRKKTLTMATLMPESGYATRAAAEARSFGELIGHTVDTNFGVCAGARTVENPRKGQPAEGVITDKATLVTLLTESFAFCDPAFAALTPTSVAGSDVVFLLTHTSEMMGALGSYLREHGLTIDNAEIDRPKKKTS